MSDYEIRNAIIRGAWITTEDGYLTSRLDLDYGGSRQGFGGFVLAPTPSSEHWPGNINAAGIWMWRVLDIAGVRDWHRLPCKTIRVKANHSGVRAIGHITEDRWFYPEDEFKCYAPEKAA